MQEHAIKEAQSEFFRKNKSGCAFAAYAAKGPSKYGWKVTVLPVSLGDIVHQLHSAIADPEVQALSMIFPDVTSVQALIGLIDTCLKSDIFSDEGHETEIMKHVRLRAKVGDDVSWVTGFAPLDFLPATRQAPFCELTIRVKPRPTYDWYFKAPKDGIIHLADLDMKGLHCDKLWKLWGVSFETTKNILGHSPDEESAARTTFAIPLELIKDTSV